MFSIKNKSINIIEEDDDDIIFRRLLKCNYTKCNGRMVDFHIKVIYESRNQDL